MNKYEKMMVSLREEANQEYEEYVQEYRSLTNQANTACHKYNDQVHAINSLRQELRDDIRALFKFLKRFGDKITKISPFDYITEDSKFIDTQSARSSKQYNFERQETSTAVKAASVVSLVAAPVALPAILIGDSWIKRSKSKKEYQEMLECVENDRCEWEKSKTERRQEAIFYKSVAEIASIYRGLITTVQEAIRETIMPELAGIDAFMVADAIKEYIIGDMDPNNAEISNIAMYQGTAYEMHYIFVKNTFDYYTLLANFFTRPILTNIVEDGKLTAEEKRKFDKDVADIRYQTNRLRSESVFSEV